MNIVLITLIQNVALLLAMMVVFDLSTSRKQVQSRSLFQVASGVIIGGLCIGLMLASFQLETGIVFDARSVLLSLSGLFLGAIPTVIAMGMAAIYRFTLGGIGIWTGISVILATGGIGILWRHYRPGRLEDISFPELYCFGVVVHLVMLALMLTLPWESAIRVLEGVGLPVLLVYPIATIALGGLLVDRLRREYLTIKMAKSEARYRSHFEAANVGKSVTLPTGEIEVNQAFCDMLGYNTPEDLIGKNWQELTPPEDIDAISERVAPLLRGERKAIRFEKRYIHKNNSYVWADISVTVLRDKVGDLLNLIVTVVDITERKLAELALQKSEKKYRFLFEQSVMGTYLHDMEGRFVDANNAACMQIKYTKEELLSLSVFDLLPGKIDKVNLPEEGVVRLWNHWQLGERFVYEDEHQCKDGTIIQVLISAGPVEYEHGKRILVMVQDITKRKLAEFKLLSYAEEVEQQRKNLEERLYQSANAISKIGELRDVYTASHQKKVADLSCAIGREMGLADEKIRNLLFGGLLLDVGKFYIPSDILNKPGKVSDLEYKILQTHVEKSCNVAKEIDFPEEIYTMIYQHHERLDGSGYPQGLSGDEIILESRILAVADVVTAMSFHRPYRSALGINAALEEIELHKGSRFDADVVDICIRLFREKKFQFNEE